MGNFFISDKIQYKPSSPVVFTIVHPPQAEPTTETTDFHLIRYNTDKHIWEKADAEIIKTATHPGQTIWTVLAPSNEGTYKYGIALMVTSTYGDGITRPTYQMVILDHVDIVVATDTTYIIGIAITSLGVVSALFGIFGGFRGIYHEIDKRFISGADDMEVIRRERTGGAGPRYPKRR
jgi:hypothetical protein